MCLPCPSQVHQRSNPLIHVFWRSLFPCLSWIRSESSCLRMNQILGLMDVCGQLQSSKSLFTWTAGKGWVMSLNWEGTGTDVSLTNGSWKSWPKPQRQTCAPKCIIPFWCAFISLPRETSLCKGDFWPFTIWMRILSAIKKRHMDS